MRPTVRRATAGVSLTLALAVPVASASAAPGHGPEPEPAPATATRTLHGSLHAASDDLRAAVRAARADLRSFRRSGPAWLAYTMVRDSSTSAAAIQKAWDDYAAADATAVGNFRWQVGTARAAWVAQTEPAFAAYDQATDPAHAAAGVAYRTSVRSAHEAGITGSYAAQDAYEVCVAGTVAIRDAGIAAAYALFNTTQSEVFADELLATVRMLQEDFTNSPTTAQCQREKQAAVKVAREQRRNSWKQAREAYRLATGRAPAYSPRRVAGPGSTKLNSFLCPSLPSPAARSTVGKTRR